MQNLIDHTPLFTICVEDVQSIAKGHFGRRLTEDELERVQKGIEFGLECWEEVVICAIEELESDSVAPPNS